MKQPDQDPFVVIAVPFLNALPMYFVDTLDSLSKPPRCVRVFVKDTPVDVARNRLCQMFLEEYPDATHLFFMDSDMVFPPGALARLISHDVDIVSGCYYARTDTPVPHAYKFSRASGGINWYHPMLRELKTYLDLVDAWDAERPSVEVIEESCLLPADAVGAGCLLLSRKVVEDLFIKHDGMPFENWRNSKGGEDFRFCERARDAGYTVNVDFSVQCNHHITGFVGRPDFVHVFQDSIDNEYVVDGGPSIQEATTTTAVRGVPPRPVISSADSDISHLRFQQGGSGFSWDYLDHVQGYLSEPEARELARLATAAPFGVVVELGTYKGRSAMALMSSGKKLVMIDHFGGERFEPGHVAHPDHLAGSYWPDLVYNLTRWAPAGSVWNVVTGETCEVPEQVICASMVFIDADHRYIGVKADYEAWKDEVVAGGILAFHDSNRVGVARVIREAIADGWVIMSQVGSVTAMKREQE